MEMTAEMNQKLNEFVASGCLNWEEKEWSVWAQNDDGAVWYTVLGDDGLPSDDNIIEGETGERMYLDRDDASAQWGEHVGLVSLDNGLTFKQVSELSDDEVAQVIADIENHQPQSFPEFDALCNELSGLYDTNRGWLEAFMSRLCSEYIIG